jgi:hypothetical protein
VEAVAVAFSMAWLTTQVEGKTGDDRARGLLAAFRGELDGILGATTDGAIERLRECLLEPVWKLRLQPVTRPLADEL